MGAASKQVEHLPVQTVLVVDRRYWLRGKFDPSSGDGFLNNGEKMCILGIYLHQVVKIPEFSLKGINTPASFVQEKKNRRRMKAALDKIADAKACWLLSMPDKKEERFQPESIYDSDAAEAIYRINDSEKISDKERERRITKHFKRFGVEVQFTH